MNEVMFCHHSVPASSAFTYSIVSVSIVAATLIVRHAVCLAHDESRSALAAFHAEAVITIRGGCQVGTGRGAS